MIKDLLAASGGRLLFPLALVVCGIYLAKGLFGLYRSRSQERRDFLDLFPGWEQRNDLWLTVAVRHVFGAYLPPALIRRLMASAQPGRALLEVASAWDLLEMDDKTGEVEFRCKLLGCALFRSVTRWIAAALYVAFALVAAFCALHAYSGEGGTTAPWVLWLYSGIAAIVAIRLLSYAYEIGQAHVAVRRWLGIR